jgi:hypothetical protein
MHVWAGYLIDAPSTRRFFSGSRLPLATESSIELQSSFFCSPFLPSEPPEAVVCVENLFALAVMMPTCAREP